MKIVFNPKYDPRNLYPEIIVETLEENGIFIFSLKEFFKKISVFKEVKIVHLNWFENIIGKNFFKVRLNFFFKATAIFLLVICRKKIIWTMHNRVPHDKEKVSIQTRLMVLLIKKSSVIIVHSNLTEQCIFDLVPISDKIRNKIRYVPHPDYINKYGNIIESNCADKDKKLNLLFIGAVKPYKNIEILIDIVKKYPEDVTLNISGRACTEVYRKLLLERGLNSANIKYSFEFVEEKEFPDLISKCDLFVLPYDKSSSLNSGVIMLAFSYQKCVISSEIGTVEKDELKAINLIYNYNDTGEHKSMLEKKILEAIEMKKQNKEVFSYYGKLCYDFIEKSNNSNFVCSELINIYNSLK